MGSVDAGDGVPGAVAVCCAGGVIGFGCGIAKVRLLYAQLPEKGRFEEPCLTSSLRTAVNASTCVQAIGGADQDVLLSLRARDGDRTHGVSEDVHGRAHHVQRPIEDEQQPHA